MKLLLKAFDSISNPFTAFFFEDSHYLFHYDTDITVVKCATSMFEAFAEWALSGHESVIRVHQQSKIDFLNWMLHRQGYTTDTI